MIKINDELLLKQVINFCNNIEKEEELRIKNVSG